jgi:hypothetical protein
MVSRAETLISDAPLLLESNMQGRTCLNMQPTTNVSAGKVLMSFEIKLDTSLVQAYKMDKS